MSYIKYVLSFLLISMVTLIDARAESTTPLIQSTTIVMPDGTIPPDIPDQVIFCGELVNLSRYDLRERFDREMIAMMYMHSSSIQLLKLANRYFPVIEPILKSYGIPDDFKYLACIESGLNYRAVSSARAVGMWQFIPETGIQYGLEINNEVDERYNIEKETIAACLYLNYAYSLYGDWLTAAASYNTGYVRVSSELERQRAEKGLDLWLFDETMRYMLKILACKEFLQEPKKFNFFVKREQLYPPFVLKDTLISGKVSNWVDVAVKLGISYYDLKSFNTWIRSDSLTNATGKVYKVIYPAEESRFYNVKQIPLHQKNWVIDEH